MEIEVKLDKLIDFSPATRELEIIQNVRMIVGTIRESIPMQRDFGISGVLDLPIHIFRAKMTAEIADAIKKNEPRAQLISINFDGEAMDGELNPTVTIAIKER